MRQQQATPRLGCRDEWRWVRLSAVMRSHRQIARWRNCTSHPETHTIENPPGVRLT